MNKYNAGLTFIILFLFSCGHSFQDDALEAASDGKITKAEMAELVTSIQGENDPAQQQLFYTNGKIDTAKVADYLVGLFKTQELKVHRTDIWPAPTTAKSNLAPFNFNIFLENSGSMDGYVAGSTRFKDAVYSLLGNISNTFNGKLNLNYINSKITFSQPNADANGIREFIQNLTPATFKAKGGVRESSDIRDLLHQVIDKTDNGNVSILISDFVFSPGKKVNAHNYLVNQSIGIKIELAEKLKTYSLAIEVIQMNSQFNGKYFDLNNTPIPINGDRPYYVWFIGNQAQLVAIRNSGIIDNIKTGVEHNLIFCAQPAPLNEPFKILYSGKNGDFQLAGGTTGDISEPVPADGTSGDFAFEVATNNSGDIRGLDFYDDMNNYTHDGNYQIAVSRIGDTSDVITKGYTHRIHFSTKSLRKQNLTVLTRMTMPGWVLACTSDDDRQIKGDSAQMKKTFGLQFLLQGVYDAFYVAPHNNIVSQLKINIK